MYVYVQVCTCNAITDYNIVIHIIYIHYNEQIGDEDFTTNSYNCSLLKCITNSARHYQYEVKYLLHLNGYQLILFQFTS